MGREEDIRRYKGKIITSQSSNHESCTEPEKRTRERTLLSLRMKELYLYLRALNFDGNR